MQDLKVQLELFSDMGEEMKPLFENHWEEVALYTDVIDLCPDYDKYKQLEEMGMVKIVTARKEEELVGYVVLFVQPHLHYLQDIWCSMDIIYLAPYLRKTGIGAELVKASEEVAKGCGASVLQFSTKVKQPFDTLMKWTGFDLVERVYSKCLKEK